MVLGKIIWTISGVNHPLVEQWTGSWLAIILVGILGLFTHRFINKTGFPEIWDINISNKWRFLVPGLLGLLVAVVEIIISLEQKLPKDIHVPFPYSIPVYLTGGIFLEMLYHFIPIILLTWLVSDILLKKKWQSQVFWIFAILLSLWEPTMQIIGMLNMEMITSLLFSIMLFIFIFVANMVPLALFRKYGFLAPVVFRISDYLLWHVIFPMIG